MATLFKKKGQCITAAAAAAILNDSSQFCPKFS